MVMAMTACSSAPRYTTNTTTHLPALRSESKTKFIPVTHNPKLSYQRTWVGIASWYGDDFVGKLTANGEIFDKHAKTAAHKTLPLGTIVKVTNLANNRSTKVRINDRGPYVEGRLIDLSYAAAKELGFDTLGTTQVRLQVIKFGDNSYKK